MKHRYLGRHLSKNITSSVRIKTSGISRNHGSTLVTVVICLAFIGILGALLLSVTMMNLQMKMIESKAKKNFYSCESVMEKIRVAVQEIASESVKNIYENDVLENYATYLTMSEDDRNADIKKKVILEFIKTIGVTAGYADDNAILASAGIVIQPDYFLNHLYLDTNENNAISWPVLIYENLGDTYCIRMKDIRIEFVQGDYRTSITSDIVITMPEFSFTVGTGEEHYSMLQPYSDYVLIADGAVNSDNLTGTTQIQGNVYAGTSGINISGQNSGGYSVNINGAAIVTRGNITVNDTAKLRIGTTTVPVIWADNLIAATSPSYPSGSSLLTELDINGFSVIKDDLSLEGQNCKAALQSGAYLGYTGAHSAEGSAMMINGYGSSLDLSGLADLVLAGRAHVDVQDITLNKDSEILTGESIAIKSNQRAYLLHGEFITNIRHNPVTEADYQNPLIGTPSVTIDDSATAISYNDYVAATPYKIAAKQTGTDTLRYYYLNFADGRLADQYLNVFFTLYSGVLNNMAPFRLGTVKLPAAGNASIAGNAMSYNTTDGLGLTPGMSSIKKADGSDLYPDDASLDTAIASLILNKSVYASTVLDGRTVNQLDSMYAKISHLLSLDSTGAYQDSDQTAASTIKTGGVDYLIDSGMSLSATTTVTDYQCYRGDKIFNNTDPSVTSFWVIDGNVTISPNASFHGFLIANGDITVGDGAELTGLIISTAENSSGAVMIGNSVTLSGRIVTKGSVSIGTNCNLGTDAAAESYVASLFQAEGNVLKNIFKNAQMTVDFVIATPASSTVDLTDMISYENWRKTE